MGLTEKEVEALREEYGYNEILRKETKTKLEILIDVIIDPIIIIMAVAAIISLIAGISENQYTEFFVIMSLIVVNVLISFIQENKTIAKLEALAEMNEATAIVIRDNLEKEIPSRELVPGDVVKLKIGQIARADLEVKESNNLGVDESFLTGESIDVMKEKGDFVYSNSMIKDGAATGVVVNIGMKTKIGEIAQSVDNVKEGRSQLEKKILTITKILLVIAFCTAVLVLVLALLNDFPLLESLNLTISILIATVPEGLATVLTIVLTYMSVRMSKNNALAKKVELLETLGEVSYVCTDKTGTITENKMSVNKHTYFSDDHSLDQKIVKATIDRETPTSKAINTFINEQEITTDFKQIDLLPFNSERKYQVQLISDGQTNYLVVIGAPDFIIENLNEKIPHFTEYTELGLRTLLFTYKETTATKLTGLDHSDFFDLNLSAFFGIQDPPKESAITAIEQMHTAGIKVVMITGDNIETAKSIAKQTNIMQTEEDIALTGEELEKLTDQEFAEIVEHVRVYARVQPEDKYRIVSTLENAGEIVAMTGDGTNDSIALKKANVGIAMGINGTDISKESADLILLDDNFSTIGVAIKSGRQIFDNLKKFIRQMLTSNSAHTGSLLSTLIFSLILAKEDIILPITAVLILWVNIISDAIPCLALGLEEPEADIMEKKPVDPNEQILHKSMIFEILIRGFSIGLLVYFVFTYFLNHGYEVTYARSLAFATLSFGQLIHIYDARSFKTIYLKKPFSNKLLNFAVLLSAALNLLIIYSPLNSIFSLTSVKITDLITVILISATVTFGYSLIKLAYLKVTKKI